MNLTALLLTLGIVTAPINVNIYPTTMVVTDINYQEDYITLTDCNGESWEWSGVEDWQVNDMASCLLSDNGTHNIYDDQILEIRYCGF